LIALLVPDLAVEARQGDLRLDALASVQLRRSEQRFVRLVRASVLEQVPPEPEIVAGLAPLIYVKARTHRFDGLSVIQVISAMLLAVYTSFYHVTPEYYIMLLAVLFVVFRLRGGVIVGYGIFSLAWVINLAYGVSQASAPGTRSLPGKARFVELYERFIPIPAETLDVIATLLFAACTVWLTVLLTRAAAQAVSRPEPPTPPTP